MILIRQEFYSNCHKRVSELSGDLWRQQNLYCMYSVSLKNIPYKYYSNISRVDQFLLRRALVNYQLSNVGKGFIFSS